MLTLPKLHLLLTVGRSGSSAIAHIFHEHGLWVGDCKPGDQFNHKGYFENRKIKQLMMERYGRDFLVPKVFKHSLKTGVERILQEQGCDRDWLFKTGYFYYDVFRDFSPKLVKITRNLQDTFRSYEKSLFLKRYTSDQIIKIINDQYNLSKEIDGPEVNFDLILKKDYSQLKEAIEYCGLTFNKSIVEDIIDYEKSSRVLLP